MSTEKLSTLGRLMWKQPSNVKFCTISCCRVKLQLPTLRSIKTMFSKCVSILKKSNVKPNMSTLNLLFIHYNSLTSADSMRHVVMKLFYEELKCKVFQVIVVILTVTHMTLKQSRSILPSISGAKSQTLHYT